MKKTLAAAALLTAATGAMLAMSAPAQAGAPEGMGGDDTQQVRIGDNLCALPWYWEGPANAGVVGKSVTYKACTDSDDDDDAKVSILSDICVAPWHWNGPLNILNFGVSADYQACTEG